MPKVYFNKEQFNKCLDFIESAMIDWLECSIDLQHLEGNDKEDLVDVCNTLNAVRVLRNIDYDDYDE